MLKLSQKAPIYKTEALKIIFKALSDPEVISFAGGIPSPESFPINLIKKFSQKILEEKGTAALQYNKTAGIDELRENIANWFNKKNLTNFKKENVLITTGSTQALDLLGKIFIDPHDEIAVENPTYLGALWGFNPFEPTYITIESESDGINLNDLEEKIKNLKNLKFLYIVSTFQNPTGRVISLQKRVELTRLAQKYNFLIVEDDPYSYLRYYGNPVKPIISIDTQNVIYLSTFSKILAPGFRIGFVIANTDIIEWLSNAKESADLHSGVFDQFIVSEFLKEGLVEKRIEQNIRLYKPRFEKMGDMLSKKIKGKAKWIKPEGGMFYWLEFDKSVDTSELYKKAIKNKVAFVPGVYFFAKNDKKNCIRLNFTVVSEEKIEKGIQLLAEII